MINALLPRWFRLSGAGPLTRPLLFSGDRIKEIRTWALKASLLPNPVPGSNIYKPATW